MVSQLCGTSTGSYSSCTLHVRRIVRGCKGFISGHHKKSLACLLFSEYSKIRYK